MNKMKEKIQKKERRAKRTRKKLKAKTKRNFRLSVFRSNKHIYLQLVDLSSGKTLFGVSDLSLDKIAQSKNIEFPQVDLQGKKAQAFKVGFLAAKLALERKIDKVSFDKGPYKYHGLVKAAAEGARKGGLIF